MLRKGMFPVTAQGKAYRMPQSATRAGIPADQLHRTNSITVVERIGKS